MKLCTESIAVVKFFEKPQNMKWKKNTDKKVWHTAHANSEEEFIVSNIHEKYTQYKS